MLVLRFLSGGICATGVGEVWGSGAFASSSLCPLQRVGMFGTPRRGIGAFGRCPRRFVSLVILPLGIFFRLFLLLLLTL